MIITKNLQREDERRYDAARGRGHGRTILIYIDSLSTGYICMIRHAYSCKKKNKCTRYVIVACKRSIHPEQSVHQHIGLSVVYFLHLLSVWKDARSSVSLNSAGGEN